jgi:hypothetical protein
MKRCDLFSVWLFGSVLALTGAAQPASDSRDGLISGAIVLPTKNNEAQLSQSPLGPSRWGVRRKSSSVRFDLSSAAIDRSLYTPATPFLPPAASVVREDRAAALAVAELRNDDVRWESGFVGPTPRLSPRALAALQLGRSVHPYLLDALQRESQFVVAHVMLTIVQNGRFAVTQTTWNGLQVDVGIDGATTYPAGQREEIMRLWGRRLRLPRGVDGGSFR